MTAPEPSVLTVAEAVATGDGPVRIRGYVLAEAGAGDPGGTGTGTVVLCSALAETWPPQPGGAMLEVAGSIADVLSGLGDRAAADVERAGPVAWTPRPVVVEGVVAGRMLTVGRPPLSGPGG